MEEINLELVKEEYIISFDIENSSSKPMRLFVEPWPYEYWLLPNESIVFVAKGPKAGHPKFIYQDDVIIYCAWVQSVFAVYKDGELISHSLEECLTEPSPILLEHAYEILKYRGEIK